MTRPSQDRIVEQVPPLPQQEEPSPFECEDWPISPENLRLIFRIANGASFTITEKPTNNTNEP
jgi:hypothetical protein